MCWSILYLLCSSMFNTSLADVASSSSRSNPLMEARGICEHLYRSRGLMSYRSTFNWKIFTAVFYCSWSINLSRSLFNRSLMANSREFNGTSMNVKARNFFSACLGAPKRAEKVDISELDVYGIHVWDTLTDHYADFQWLDISVVCQTKMNVIYLL